MHLRGGPSWRLSINDPADLAFALYVRDACGLVTRGDIPRLTPGVPVTTPAALHARGLRTQWEAWWSAMLADRLRARTWYSTFVSWRLGVLPDEAVDTAMPGGAELLQAREAHLRPAMRWRSAHRFHRRRDPDLVRKEDRLLETYLVRAIEESIGRRSRPFEYVVEIIPVAGRRFWDVTATRLLASEELLADPGSYRDVLRPRLTALA